MKKESLINLLKNLRKCDSSIVDIEKLLTYDEAILNKLARLNNIVLEGVIYRFFYNNYDERINSCLDKLIVVEDKKVSRCINDILFDVNITNEKALKGIELIAKNNNPIIAEQLKWLIKEFESLDGVELVSKVSDPKIASLVASILRHSDRLNYRIFYKFARMVSKMDDVTLASYIENVLNGSLETYIKVSFEGAKIISEEKDLKKAYIMMKTIKDLKANRYEDTFINGIKLISGVDNLKVAILISYILRSEVLLEENIALDIADIISKTKNPELMVYFEGLLKSFYNDSNEKMAVYIDLIANKNEELANAIKKAFNEYKIDSIRDWQILETKDMLKDLYDNEQIDELLKEINDTEKENIKVTSLIRKKGSKN